MDSIFVELSGKISAIPNAKAGSALAMPPFLYKCPNTGQTVQGVPAEETSGDTYEAITCLACQQNHFVNPITGKVLGEDDDE